MDSTLDGLAARTAARRETGGLAWPAPVLLVVALLTVLHLAPPPVPYTIRLWLNLNEEGTIGAWFTSLALATTAAAAWCLGRVAADPRHRPGWWLIAGLYAMASVDEVIALHEALARFLSTDWYLFYSPFAALALIVVARFLVALRQPHARRLLVGMGLQLLGGFGCEAVSHLLFPLPHGWQQAEFMAEEGLEMAGAVIAAHACLAGLMSQVSVRPRAGAPSAG